VTRSLAEQGRLIRLPVHMGEKIRRLRRIARQIEQEEGRRPTMNELADAVGIQPRKVKFLLRMSQRPTSLEKPVGEDEDSYKTLKGHLAYYFGGMGIRGYDRIRHYG
jgi:RNA polymerase primary sigma factor